ncbi:type II toxin-antitoxin system VapC family toxin [Isoptericola hypogeus]|uniref:Ribonuclease VapC n=1 Tax=Isoptericola hypogeus TaxID=300179 RepID=A0ABN2JNC2_9MICO
MTYLLDTNVISELRKSPSRREPAVFAWADAQPDETLHTSAICLLELEMGVLRKERTFAAQGARLRHWLESVVVPGFGERVLPFDAAAARRAAMMHVPDHRSDRDCLIAATAAAHDLVVVTQNVADMEPTGVAVLNPWLRPEG